MIAPQTLVGIVADRLGAPFETVAPLASGIDPANPYSFSAELILRSLADGFTTWKAWLEAVDGSKALPMVAAFIEALANIEHGAGDLAKTAYRCVVSVDPESVLITCHCDDGAEVMIHAASATYSPARVLGMVTSKSISGRSLFLLARDIAEHLPRKIEQRTDPFKLGTINGRPIADATAIVDAFAANTPVAS